MRGIEEAISLGFSPLKINVVVMKGLNDDEILDFVEFTKEKVCVYIHISHSLHISIDRS